MQTTVVLYRQAVISMSKAINRSVRAESARFHTKHSVVSVGIVSYTSRFDKTWSFI